MANIYVQLYNSSTRTTAYEHCKIFVDGTQVAEGKYSWTNRSWQAFEFEKAMKDALRSMGLDDLAQNIFDTVQGTDNAKDLVIAALEEHFHLPPSGGAFEVVKPSKRTLAKVIAESLITPAPWMVKEARYNPDDYLWCDGCGKKFHDDDLQMPEFNDDEHGGNSLYCHDCLAKMNKERGIGTAKEDAGRYMTGPSLESDDEILDEIGHVSIEPRFFEDQVEMSREDFITVINKIFSDDYFDETIAEIEADADEKDYDDSDRIDNYRWDCKQEFLQSLFDNGFAQSLSEGDYGGGIFKILGPDNKPVTGVKLMTDGDEAEEVATEAAKPAEQLRYDITIEWPACSERFKCVATSDADAEKQMRAHFKKNPPKVDLGMGEIIEMGTKPVKKK
jgi:hypothetical protein